MNNIDLMNLNESYYTDDIDTPLFDYLKKTLVTKNYVLQPLENEHFLDLFEFRLQNEPLESDPFDKLGEKFENAYTQFFTYMYNMDNIAWVLMDRIYIVGFFLLELDVDYNNYMDRNAHLYYEMNHTIKDVDSHTDCIKTITDQLFGESDIPLLELHIDEETDIECRAALERLGFAKDSKKTPDTGCRYHIENKNPIIKKPPRHMPFILQAYKDAVTSTPKSRNFPLS